MTATRIARFMVRHFFHNADTDRIKSWFLWYAGHDLARVSIGSNGLNGVVCFRPVSAVPEKEDWYSIDVHGNMLWIDLMVAMNPGVMRYLWSFHTERFKPGQIAWVAFRRRKHSNRVSVLPFQRFVTHMKGII